MHTQISRGGGTPHRGEVHGEASGCIRRQREKQELWFLWFLQVGMEEARQAGLGMVTLNDFGGAWGIGAIQVV